MNYKINLEKTAISNGVSNSCKLLVENYINNKTCIILDYGFGRLRNTHYMLNHNMNVDILDTKEQIQNNLDELSKLNVNIFEASEVLTEDYYNCILLSFVLNVIPNIRTRKNILNNIHLGLKKDGLLYLEVRTDNFLKNVKHKIKHNDGYILGNNNSRTFQKPYTKEEITSFLIECGFKVINVKKYSNSIVCICEKEEEN